MDEAAIGKLQISIQSSFYSHKWKVVSFCGGRHFNQFPLCALLLCRREIKKERYLAKCQHPTTLHLLRVI